MENGEILIDDMGGLSLRVVGDRTEWVNPANGMTSEASPAEVALARELHRLRHTFATLQIRRTHKVKGVSLYLGHSSTAITQDMYVHEELDLNELALDLSRRH